MARPARVRMRRRKPCVLARRRLFGWKVRLLTRFSVGCRVRSDVTMTSARLPFWGWRWPMRPQSASPWRTEFVRLGRVRGHGHAKEVADTLGQRYGSRGTRVKPAEPPGESGPNRRSSEVVRRLQGDTPRSRRSVDDSIVFRAPAPVGFRLHDPRHPNAQAVDKRVDNRASFTGTRTGQDVPPGASSSRSVRIEPGHNRVQQT